MAKCVLEHGRAVPFPLIGHERMTEGHMALTIGVDVGGTKIAAGVVDESGEILARTRVPTPADPQWAVDAIAQAVRELKEEFPEVVAVGVGAPASSTGTVPR